MIRTLCSVVALGLACALAAAAPAAARPGPALVWQQCPPDPRGVPVDPVVRCATLRLPVDWSAPTGAAFDMWVAMRPARAARIGALVFGPGGPGDSGVDQIYRGDRFTGEILDRFDVVSFDPRGVSRTAPSRCAPAPDTPRQPMPLTSQADFDATVAANRALWDSCRPASAVFDHADTLSTVRDVDALRQALGERRITFHGSSYGTLLGQQYAETFPGRVRAVVLESVFDHSLDVPTFVRTQAATLQDSFDEFVAWCDARNCLGERGARAVWRSVLTRADAGDYAPVTAADLTTLPLRRLAGPDWPTLAREIAGLDAGQPVAVGLPPLVVAAFCADWPADVPDYAAYADLVRTAAAAGPDIRYGAGLFAVHACLGWPTPVRNPPHDPHVTGGPPVLLLNARHDPRTGYDWATHVAAQLGERGRLLTYEGWGHGSYQRNACMITAVDRYLIDLTLPPPGAHCGAAVSPAGTSSGR